MRAICKVAQRHNLLIIEDCAQSFGARTGKQQTGTFGDAGCFSFFPSKNLGCYGDGGLCTTNSDEIAEQFRLLKNHGSKTRNQHQVVGWNSRLDELQAAVLRVKLKYIDTFNRQRISVARRYNEMLEQLPIQTPELNNDLSHVFHQYTLLSEIRNTVVTQFLRQQIGHAIYYPTPLPSQKAFSNISRASDLTNTNTICAQCISLPMFPEMADEQIQTVVNAVTRAYAS